MENKKSKKVLASVLAVVLAFAMLIGGGTYAYLQSSTDDVKNSFKTNNVEVLLAETTGQEYNIVPGMEQAKDPKVTVNNTVDAYVYVEVTDNTQGLITYAIADGWAKLEGYDNIYYREVAKDAETKVFSVLAGDKVSYSKDLTNEDMKDKTDVSLTFNATAIQKEPFGTALNAYNKQVPANSPQSLIDALKNGQDVTLSENIVFDENFSDTVKVKNDAKINMNGKTISNSADMWDDAGLINDWSVFSVRNNANVTFTGNGTIHAKKDDCYALDVQRGGTITIENGTYIGNISSVYVHDGSLFIKGGTFDIQQLASKENNGYQEMINCRDQNYKNGTATVEITGGTFKNFNPADNAAEGLGTNFVPEGYTVETRVEGNDTWYTVVPATA